MVSYMDMYLEHLTGLTVDLYNGYIGVGDTL